MTDKFHGELEDLKHAVEQAGYTGAWTDNGALAKRVVTLAMAHPVSRQWKGYWQR